MEIVKKINAKQDLWNQKPVTIAFLGDSVTHGCFECYIRQDENIETFFEYKNAYSTRLQEILHLMYPQVQINIINSGISGDSAPRGFARLERDVLSYHPDLVVVCYGLNDMTAGMAGLPRYRENLMKIFAAVQESGAELIFMTPNMSCTDVSRQLTEQKLIQCGKFISGLQNDGTMDAYMDEARRICAEMGVRLCDHYAIWKKMQESGVYITDMLSNKLNHPLREWHYYMAIKLIETMFEV